METTGTGHPTQEAAEQVRQVAGTAASEARAVVTAAKDQLSEVSSEVRGQARSVFEDSKSQLQAQAQTQTERIAENLRRIGDELRALTEGRIDEAGAVGDYARQAASTVNRFAGRIEERGLDGLVDDVQRFARRRPGTFLLGALAAGVGVGRLLRAGSAASTHAPEATDVSRQPMFPSDAALSPPTTPEMVPVSTSPPMVDAGAVVGMETGVLDEQEPVGMPPAGATS